MSERTRDWVGPVLMLVVVAALFGPAFAPGMMVSGVGGDGQSQFVPWRVYAFGRLAAGDVPLWNPLVFAGQSGVGNVQWALWYPPNWLHLVLPVGTALTLLAAAHVWAAGAWTNAWLRYRGFDRLAAAAGGLMFMLSGPVLARLFPGHMTWIAVVAWLPALMLCLDGLLRTGRMKFAWFGSGVIALMLLAGYPQPVYIGLLAAAVYAVLCSVASPHRWRAVVGLAGMVVWGAALAAVQVGPTWEAAAESVRAGRTSFAFAASYAMGWENLPQLLSPQALGPISNYRGTWLAWETWPYLGGVFLALAVTGAIHERGHRRAWSVTVVVLFALLGLGAATPLFRLAYEALPGLGSFRAPARFWVVVALFTAPLVAGGVEAVGRQRWTLVWLGAGLAGVCAWVGGNGMPAAAAGLVAAGLLGALLPSPRYRTLAVALLAGLELIWSARMLVVRSPVPMVRDVELIERTTTGRLELANLHMLLPEPPSMLTGYDPFQPRRWARFMAATQGRDPREVDEITTELLPHPAWSLLRHPPGLPRVYMTPQVEVVPNEALALARVVSPDFASLRTTVVESAVVFPGGGGDPPAELAGADTVRVVAADADRLEIEVDSPRVGMLVVTDAYASGWHARRADTGERLQVVPANYVARGVPIGPGRYVVEMWYSPLGWRAGWVLSVIGLAAWLGVGVGVGALGRKRGR
jgi:hypothetical protein